MTALDRSRKALTVARSNARRHGVSGRLQFVQSDLFDKLKKKRAWDLLVSNPPYVPREDWAGLPPDVRREPRPALDGGPRGLDVIRKVLEQAPRFLRRGGCVIMEVGGGQAAPLSKILKRDRRYGGLRFTKDLNGIERVLVVNTK